MNEEIKVVFVLMNMNSAKVWAVFKKFELKILHLCVVYTSPVGHLVLSDSLYL